MDHLEEDRMIQVFDMMVKRLDNIEENMLSFKEYFQWKERHTQKETVEICGVLFNLPFDYCVKKHHPEDPAESKCFLFQFTIDDMLHTSHVKAFSKNLLSSQAYRLFWNDNGKYLSLEELDITSSSFRYVDDYIIYHYLNYLLCSQDTFVLKSIATKERTLYAYVEYSVRLYHDQALKKFIETLDMYKHSRNVQVYVLKEGSYQSLYPLVFFSDRKREFKVFSETLRETVTELFRNENKESIRSYYGHTRFRGLVDIDELMYALRFV